MTNNINPIRTKGKYWNPTLLFSPSIDVIFTAFQFSPTVFGMASGTKQPETCPLEMSF
jgi:hypothetical protein